MVLLIFVIPSIVVSGIHYLSKKHAIDMICQHPELSDAKVESISRMIRKNHKRLS